jgi:hypothetical protein
MPLSLPTDVRSIVDAYRTCEFVTLSRDGTPIAWPTTSAYRPADGTFVISTSIGFAQKALNVRRDPRVALLFSEPTGSGLDGASTVLIRGVATCPEHIETSFLANADLWERVLAFQPSSRRYGLPLVRSLMDAYFLRLIITITPESVDVLPPRRARSAIPGNAASIVSALAGFPDSVLASRDASGAPTLVRVAVRTSPGEETLELDLPQGTRVVDGRASLLSHAHNDDLWQLRSVVVLGSVEAGRFHAERVVRGDSGNSIAGIVATLRNLRGTAARYLARRGLDRPRPAWNEFREITARIDAR